MKAEANIAATAALLADPTRSLILLALLDGRSLPAGELAHRARVGFSTASSHLAKLVEGRLLVVEPQGRHRYYRLASPAVGQVIESLATIAPPVPVRSLRDAQTGAAIHFARTCYDHLAGTAGVALARALVESETLTVAEKLFDVTAAGATRLAAFGVEIPSLKRQRRAFAPCCLDWSERRHHVAGALGAAITSRMFALGWIRRMDGSRAVTVTEAGRAGLADQFGVTF